MIRTSLIASAILAAPAALAQTPAEHPHDMSKMKMDGMDMSKMNMAGMDMGGMTMPGMLGDYPATRDASGTSWQPDAASHSGVHAMAGDWMLMGHALFNGVYSWQDGPRGDDKAFLAGMVMGMARRSFMNGDTLSFRAMLSPDPLMGKDGYPLLLQGGETADGVTPLVDRQHPHDLFMELSASYAKRLTDKDSLYIYGGLPGEPAFGPPAFMHRPAAVDDPAAPITHHWLDSTHITFGVVTAGWAHGPVKIEASQFHGREPDQHRYDIETGALDSTAVRVSWNPGPNWALQASWANQKSPEQLEPDVDEKRWSASALYTRKLGESGELSFTGAWGRKERSDGVDLNGWLGEAAWKPNGKWTVFGRAEKIETDELALVHDGVVRKPSEVSLGLIRDWRVAEHVLFGVGGLVSHNWTDGLSASYGGDPNGAMGFVRLKIG
ncbi:MAG: hypothetical protein GC155_02580 [Alphaproteobacteria bacterium]|nr:hypothetical protein [Alphaproteobacteria bacterium]